MTRFFLNIVQLLFIIIIIIIIIISIIIIVIVIISVIIIIIIIIIRRDLCHHSSWTHLKVVQRSISGCWPMTSSSLRGGTIAKNGVLWSNLPAVVLLNSRMNLSET